MVLNQRSIHGRYTKWMHNLKSIYYLYSLFKRENFYLYQMVLQYLPVSGSVPSAQIPWRPSHSCKDSLSENVPILHNQNKFQIVSGTLPAGT